MEMNTDFSYFQIDFLMHMICNWTSAFYQDKVVMLKILIISK